MIGIDANGMESEPSNEVAIVDRGEDEGDPPADGDPPTDSDNSGDPPADGDPPAPADSEEIEAR